ncbi:MAG TPA: heterodisulfide reductase-related iron-sulfur binding cluster [Verrucomicrobiota bacterium]|nr:heterodisulfide reductase-related iron-sulfur binding cluster [Verrucomicrobiota bacterium]
MSALGQFLDEDKALSCVHCGLCLSSCPTYLETGNENNSPRGRIYTMRAMHSGQLEVGAVPVRHVDLCLGCRACETACPSGVQYGMLLEQTRDHIEKHHGRGLFQWLLRRLVIEQVFPFPWRMRLALLPVRLVRVLRLGVLLPEFAREMMELLPRRLATGSLPTERLAKRPSKGKVGFIEGCAMRVMFGDTNESSAELLNREGWDVLAPKGQGCCGALYAHSGQLAKARDCARRNIAAFDKQPLDAIIINAAGCGSTLVEYGELLKNDPVWAKRAETFSSKVKDLVSWLEGAGCANSGTDTKVTYHDACHLAHAQGITAKPRALVKALAGDGFVELAESDLCCGSAGSYNLTEPEMANRLQQRKVQNIIDSGAEVVVTTNPGCLLQIQSGLRKAGAHHIRVVHIADYLLEGGTGVG